MVVESGKSKIFFVIDILSRFIDAISHLLEIWAFNAIWVSLRGLNDKFGGQFRRLLHGERPGESQKCSRLTIDGSMDRITMLILAGNPKRT